MTLPVNVCNAKAGVGGASVVIATPLAASAVPFGSAATSATSNSDSLAGTDWLVRGTCSLERDVAVTAERSGVLSTVDAAL